MEDLRADWKAVKVKGRRRPIAPKAEPLWMLEKLPRKAIKRLEADAE